MVSLYNLFIQNFERSIEMEIKYGGYSENLINVPLWWHKKGLRQTTTGFGRKLTTEYKIKYNNKLYRVYCTCFSNCGSLWFTVKGERMHIRC